MAAPLQTFLFNYGKEMAGKHIGLIVSSASSGISSVESDAKRLIPDGDFFPSSLWIRSAQTSSSASLIRQWLKDIDYDAVAAIENITGDIADDSFTVYTLSGSLVGRGLSSVEGLDKGFYIINVVKYYKTN